MKVTMWVHFTVEMEVEAECEDQPYQIKPKTDALVNPEKADTSDRGIHVRTGTVVGRIAA